MQPVNFLKTIIFNLYCKYEKQIPSKVNWRLVNLLYKVLGLGVYKIDGISLELNPISLLDRKLIKHEAHDDIVKKMFLSCLNDGGTFIDVGANIGYFSLIAASMRNVKVLAFEPSPRELIRLYNNIRLNGFSNITVFPYGLSTETATVTLNLASEINPGMNSVLDLTDSMPCSKCINADFTTLEALVSSLALSDVRLCKIDVEGWEMSVLNGMATTIHLMNKAAFIVEITPKYLAKAGNQVDDIYNFFEKYGYRPRFGVLDLSQYDEVFTKYKV